MISEQEIDSILFLEFSGKPKGELRRIREDTLDFNVWLEGIGHTLPSAEDYDGYARERKIRVGKTASQPYEAAEKAAARVRAMYEALARQKGEGAMSEVVEVEEGLQGVHEQEAETPLPVEVEEDTPKPRGRKPKPECDRRSVKFSVYLTPRLYEGAKELASMKQQDLSDVIFSLLEGFVERNSDKLREHQNFLASLGEIK